MKKTPILIFFLSVLAILSACGGTDNGNEEIDVITFADSDWDSIKVHNFIAQTIIEEGYNYDTETVHGSTMATFQGMIEGDIDVYMDLWTDNLEPAYSDAIDEGEVIQLSVNYDDNDQGLYVPTYVIEGDEERGIEPMAPDLRTVEDLKNYPDVFEDPDDPGRGRILNAPSGWTVEEKVTMKFDTYGLNETMNNFLPGSDSALVADLQNHYENGEAWVGYYYAPTWVTAKFDLTLLEEPEYDLETYNETGGTAFPPNDVVVAANNVFTQVAPPEILEFLESYETSTDLTEESLIYMFENDASADEAAIWWMNEHEDIWTGWVPEDVAEVVKDALQ